MVFSLLVKMSVLGILIFMKDMTLYFAGYTVSRGRSRLAVRLLLWLPMYCGRHWAHFNASNVPARQVYVMKGAMYRIMLVLGPLVVAASIEKRD